MRSFAVMLAVAGVVSSLVTLAIGDEIARGLAWWSHRGDPLPAPRLGDTRDLMFAFAALAIGIACGTLAFPVAILGTVVFCVAVTLSVALGFGLWLPYNAILRPQVPGRWRQRSGAAGRSKVRSWFLPDQLARPG